MTPSNGHGRILNKSIQPPTSFILTISQEMAKRWHLSEHGNIQRSNGLTKAYGSEGERGRVKTFRISEEAILVCSETRCLWVVENVECSVNAFDY